MEAPDPKALIEELYRCAAACDECYKACNEEEHKADLQRCMLLDQECIEVCQVTAKLLELGTEHAGQMVALCSKICDACAEECRRHKHEHCQACAKACEKCSSECREYGLPVV
jgi:hypothetical protein